MTSFTAIGNREDLADIIFDISPMETPFCSEVERVPANATKHDWQTDALRAAQDNANLEGDDATGATLSPTTRLDNYCQILEKTVIVSRTQRRVATAGRADEYSYQTTKAGKELKRDMEHAHTRNYAASAGGEGTARHLGSIESWLVTNRTSVGTGTAQTTPGYTSGAVAAPTDSTVQGSFTKAALDAVIESAWNNGGDPTVIMCGPHNRSQISGFSGISTLQTDANATGDVTLMGAIDFYKSNFGTLRVQPNRFQRDRTVLVLDMDMWAIAVLDDLQLTPLGKTGDNDKAQLIAEETLVARNEAASGKVADCTT
jgi:hypothetical protein